MHTRGPLLFAIAILCTVSFRSRSAAQDKPYYEATRIAAVQQLISKRLGEWAQRETRHVTDWGMGGLLASQSVRRFKTEETYPSANFSKWTPDAIQSSPYEDFRAEGRLKIEKDSKRWWTDNATRRASTKVRLEPTGLVEISGQFVILADAGKGAKDGGSRHAAQVNFGLVRQQDRGLSEEVQEAEATFKSFIDECVNAAKDGKKSDGYRAWKNDKNVQAAKFWVLDYGNTLNFRDAKTESAALTMVTREGRWILSIGGDFDFAEPKAESYFQKLSKDLHDLAREIDELLVPSPPGRPAIIFLPGTIGSELYDGENRAWFQKVLDGEALPALRCKPNGEPLVQLDPRDVIRSVAGVHGVYRPFINHLEKQGYVEKQDLFVFPYDWRLTNGNPANFTRLDKLIESIDSRRRPVILICHSQGGLVARAYVSQPERAAKIAKIITIGTPYGGAPKAWKALFEGTDFDIPTYGTDSVNNVQRLVQNYSSVYQLLPDSDFVVDLLDKVVPRDEIYHWKYPDRESLPNRRAPEEGLIKQANQFRSQLLRRDQPSPVPTYVIIGGGVPTICGFSVTPKDSFRQQWHKVPESIFHLEAVKGGEKWVPVPIMNDGDGTVPAARALLPDAVATYYVANPSWGQGTDHGNLPSNSTVQMIVDGILDNKPPVKLEYKEAGMSAPKRGDEQGSLLGPFRTIDGTQAILRCDGYLTIESNGARLGMNADGSIAREIPGADFQLVANSEYASFTKSADKYRLKITGVRDGSASLELRVVRNGQVHGEFVYRSIPMTARTIAEMEITPDKLDGKAPELSLSHDDQTKKIAAEVLSKPTRTTVTEPAPAAEPTVDHPAPKKSGNYWWWVIGVVVVFGIGAATFIIMRRRRLRTNEVTRKTERSPPTRRDGQNPRRRPSS